MWGHGLPSGGSPGLCTTGGAGLLGLLSANRVAGREIVVRSSATANQRRFIFTVVNSFPIWDHSVIMYWWKMAPAQDTGIISSFRKC